MQTLSPLAAILQRIKSLPAKGKTKLVAIDGRGGSGKSSLARALVNLEPAFKTVPVDAFPHLAEEHPLHPLGTQTWVNWERLRDEVLIPLTAGDEAVFLRTPWWKDQPMGPLERVAGGGTVLVEGCYSLRRELREYYDLRIWVECAAEEAAENAIRRDGENVRKSWIEAYVPNESSYIMKHDPAAAADIVVGSQTRGFELIRDR